MAYSVSSRWEKFIRRGMHPVTTIDVSFPGEGIVYSNLPVSGGSIAISRGSAVRASGSITIPEPSLFPALNDDSPIAPYGAELIIRTGLLYPEAVAHPNLTITQLEAEGFAELVPMGVFVIGDGGGSEANGNITTLNFYDRAKLIENADGVTPKDFGGESAFVALETVIEDATPWITDQMAWELHISNELSDIVLPSGTTFDTGRWNFVTKIAEALGAEIFFGRDGDVYCVPIPGVLSTDSEVDVQWIVDAGENGVLVDVSRKITREGVFNGVVVTGSADGENPQPFALVTDDNPFSRTQFGGPFGKLIKRIDNSNVTTDEDAAIAAEAELRNLTGLQRSVDFDTFGNPAMDVGDLVLIRTINNPDEIHMVDSYRYDFANASLSASTRSLQFVGEE